MKRAIISKMTNSIKEYCFAAPKFVKDASGNAPNRESIVPHSHYLEPIINDLESGNSRKWADASNEVKLKSINKIVGISIQNNYSIDETAFALSVSYIESGFNPDASAASSSASGLGQFIDKTGASLGLDNLNRFSINANAKALVIHLKNLLERNSKHFKETAKNDLFTQTYANYHDGSRITEKTKIFSSKNIPPLVNKFKQFLVSKDCI